MITIDGYSKDPNIVPEGIVVTHGREMIKEKGGLYTFLHWFETIMSDDGDVWYHSCKNSPIHDIIYVYFIVENRLKYKGFYGGHSSKPTKAFTTPGAKQRTDFIRPHIIVGGPIEKCPYERELRGFQGFRYSEKLF